MATWLTELQAVPLAWPLVAGIAGGLVSFAAYWLVAEAETELTGQLFVAIATAVWIATASQQASDLAHSLPLSAGEAADDPSAGGGTGGISHTAQDVKEPSIQ